MEDKVDKLLYLLKTHFDERGCSCCTGISYVHNRYTSAFEFDWFGSGDDSYVRCKSTGIEFYDMDKFEQFLESLQ